jgi:hypothetical protein
MLKGGILEDGLTKASEEGTPQGSILSPLLSNIYLHYVLDLWFRAKVQKGSRGEAYYVRFADDFVACFQYQSDAKAFVSQLRMRLQAYGLQLAEDKTQCLAFGRFARQTARKNGGKPGEFTFLGLTHYCGKTKMGHFKVKRRTSRKKFRQSLRNLGDWARQARCYLRKGDLLRAAKRRIIGYLNYYAITDNSRECAAYVHHATRLVFKWVNRKSQRRAYTWAGFETILAALNWPRPRIRVDLDPFRRAEAH